MLEDLPVAAGSFARTIDQHMRLIYWICGVWFVAAQGVLFYFLWRFRQRPGVRAAWLPAEGRRELAWIFAPVLLVLVCDLVIEFDSARVWAAVKEHAPEASLEVGVHASQFAWEYQYPGPDGRLDTADDFRARQLHVPVGRVVSLRLESRDVLHSIFVPQLRLKQDIVPGRQLRSWFEATREGTWPVVCAELCGVGHTFMQSTMVAEAADTYDRWAAAQAAGGAR
ncbi:MAG: cytochrome c oxidase subunit II [Deltaproteobacteria bacterium]|nr:cytochrome c oxidase subunit II [Deltaproteobacteria bacterium]